MQNKADIGAMLYVEQFPIVVRTGRDRKDFKFKENLSENKRSRTTMDAEYQFPSNVFGFFHF